MVTKFLALMPKGYKEELPRFIFKTCYAREAVARDVWGALNNAL
jgi:hypothetical protein